MTTVCINARLAPEVSGGVEQFVSGLAHGLSELHDGDEEYIFLVNADGAEWLRPHACGPCRVFAEECPSRWARIARALRSRGELAEAARALGRMAGFPSLPASRGTVERLRTDVVHFPFQSGFATSVPSIFQPHDLQHLHWPAFFTPTSRCGFAEP